MKYIIFHIQNQLQISVLMTGVLILMIASDTKCYVILMYKMLYVITYMVLVYIFRQCL